ncbi:MAG: glycoside hydrolase family 88 protein [Pyrinomonadaceae bacterium]
MQRTLKNARSKLAAVAVAGILLANLSVQGQMEHARSIADTVMKRYPDQMVMKRFAQHLLQDNQIKPGETAEAADSRPPTWSYDIGICLTGFERLYDQTGDRKYIEYIRHILDPFIERDGTIKTYVTDEYSSDSIPNGRQLLKLYEVYKDDKYRRAAQKLRHQIALMPRNRAGGFWHKLKYPSQMWLDGLYMIEPFYARYAVVFNEQENFNDIIDQFVIMEKHSRDSKTGLLYHGWDESKLQRWANPKSGLSPEFWSRSMGWYMMALVDVLDQVPQNHLRRHELIGILRRLATAIVKVQDRDSGVWWQITDKPGKEKNYLESSATAMFVYGLAKGLRLGYISKAFAQNVERGYEGMLKQFVRIDADGTYHYIQTVSGAGLGGEPYRDGTYDYYVSEPKRDDDLKAIGPFIQACIEAELIKRQPRR